MTSKKPFTPRKASATKHVGKAPSKFKPRSALPERGRGPPRGEESKPAHPERSRGAKSKPAHSERSRGAKSAHSKHPRTEGSRGTEKKDSRADDRPLREDLVLQACLEAYGAIRHDGRLADRALDFVLRHKKNLYSSERRAVAERVYDLLRQQRTVDWLLERAQPGFATLGASTQDMLRLGASRVLHGEHADKVVRTLSLSPEHARALDRLPDAAAELEQLPAGERYALAASLPDFLADQFRARFGADAEPAAEAINARAPLTIRVNTLKTNREALRDRLEAEGVNVRLTRLSPLGLTLKTHLNAFSLPAFRDGLFEIQDEGSQLLGMLVDAPPTRVADTCAGAGGKALQLAAQMNNRGELFALDVDERRLEELKRRARRAGVHNIRIRTIPSDKEGALAALSDLAGKMDRVLVDAPCSGTGTFRRKPDARYRLTPEGLAEHSERQRRLLEQFSVLCKPGGRIVYGTCSVLPEENEQVVADFLGRHPEFTRLPAADKLGTALGERTSNAEGFLSLTPHQHHTDGFFGAILVRAK